MNLTSEAKLFAGTMDASETVGKFPGGGMPSTCSGGAASRRPAGTLNSAPQDAKAQDLADVGIRPPFPKPIWREKPEAETGDQKLTF